MQAYAGTTDTLLSFGSNGEIVFDRNTEAGLPSKVDDHYQNEGYFTGCMFRIDADDVTNITASIDRGQLYRYTSEEFVKSSDPDRWTATLNWKAPHKTACSAVTTTSNPSSPTTGWIAPTRTSFAASPTASCWEARSPSISTSQPGKARVRTT